MKQVNGLTTDAVAYRNYHVIRKLTGCDDDVADYLDKKTKKFASQMKDRTFTGKTNLSIIAFLQDFKV